MQSLCLLELYRLVITHRRISASGQHVATDVAPSHLTPSHLTPHTLTPHHTSHLTLLSLYISQEWGKRHTLTPHTPSHTPLILNTYAHQPDTADVA